jgi:uncharacterized membrane protein YdcZ (DUF606 family)
MSTGIRIGSGEIERLRNQAHRERAQFMRTFMRSNSKRLMWAGGTVGMVYLTTVVFRLRTIAFHPLG